MQDTRSFSEANDATKYSGGHDKGRDKYSVTASCLDGIGNRGWRECHSALHTDALGRRIYI